MRIVPVLKVGIVFETECGNQIIVLLAWSLKGVKWCIINTRINTEKYPVTLES
jgi:hypothetical protein